MTTKIEVITTAAATKIPAAHDIWAATDKVFATSCRRLALASASLLRIPPMTKPTTIVTPAKMSLAIFPFLPLALSGGTTSDLAMLCHPFIYPETSSCRFEARLFLPRSFGSVTSYTIMTGQEKLKKIRDELKQTFLE